MGFDGLEPVIADVVRHIDGLEPVIADVVRHTWQRLASFENRLQFIVTAWCTRRRGTACW